MLKISIAPDHPLMGRGTLFVSAVPVILAAGLVLWHRMRITMAHFALLLDTSDLLEQITLEIRTLSYLLHPPMLGELGLQHVLPQYVEGFSRRSGIGVHLRIHSNLDRFPLEIEMALFRITQEALTNIHLHSRSRTAGIALSQDSRSAILEITDQGCGIPPGVIETAEGAVGRLGVGIAGMHERVRQLGGKLEIGSHPNGTEIQVILPLALHR